MPMQGSHFDIPDTIVGVFTDFGTQKCINDDAANSDGLRGLGSLCRVLIGSPGTYYVGVTGFSPVAFDGDHTELAGRGFKLMWRFLAGHLGIATE